MTEETNKKLEEHYCKEFLKKEWFDKPGKRTLSEHMFFTAEYFAQWGINNIWHHTKDGDYPTLIGAYANQNYPQIPCLIKDKQGYGIRYWNVTEQCWDDEECDDYYCDKEAVTMWAYLDDILPTNKE